jgi:hypothetical protein
MGWSLKKVVDVAPGYFQAIFHIYPKMFSIYLMIIPITPFFPLVSLSHSQPWPPFTVYLMTSSNFTTITNQEGKSLLFLRLLPSDSSLDVQLEPAHPNGGAGPHPPPINWATRPIPRSLPTTPRKPHPMIADVNLNKGSTWNDPFRPSVLLAEATQPEYPLAHPKYHFVTTPSSGSRPREKYYVVFVGKCVGIFTFW